MAVEVHLVVGPPAPARVAYPIVRSAVVSVAELRGGILACGRRIEHHVGAARVCAFAAEHVRGWEPATREVCSVTRSVAGASGAIGQAELVDLGGVAVAVEVVAIAGDLIAPPRAGRVKRPGWLPRVASVEPPLQSRDAAAVRCGTERAAGAGNGAPEASRKSLEPGAAGPVARPKAARAVVQAAARTEASIPGCSTP